LIKSQRSVSPHTCQSCSDLCHQGSNSSQSPFGEQHSALHTLQPLALKCPIYPEMKAVSRSQIQASTLAEQGHQTQTPLFLSVECWPVASPKASGISPLVTKFYEAFKQVLCTLMFFFCYLVSVELICSEIVLTLHLFSMRKLSQTPLQPPFYEEFSIMHVTSKAKNGASIFSQVANSLDRF
jgi:hypothetical protein